MNILYNSTDITECVDPLVIRLKDNAGGMPDSVECVFSDTEGIWSQWKPQKNDALNIKNDGFATGTMYIDEIEQISGAFKLKALSIPQTAKTARTQAWENVRFLEIVNEIASRYGFKVLTYGVQNQLYVRVDQIDQADFAFLDYRCMLESCALKINDKSIVIYHEPTEEGKGVTASDLIIDASDLIGDFSFREKSTGIHQKCIVKSNTLDGYIQGEYDDSTVFGPTMSKVITCSSIEEAKRYAKGILRDTNKMMIAGQFTINLSSKIAAGINVMVKNTGMFDNKYFVDSVVHDLINSRSYIKAHKPLEGY